MTGADVLGFASLGVAVVALVTSVFAPRRDRGYLLIREGSWVAGTRILTVVNVGLRPVRIIGVVTRRHAEKSVNGQA